MYVFPVLLTHLESNSTLHIDVQEKKEALQGMGVQDQSQSLCVQEELASQTLVHLHNAVVCNTCNLIEVLPLT